MSLPLGQPSKSELLLPLLPLLRPTLLLLKPLLPLLPLLLLLLLLLTSKMATLGLTQRLRSLGPAVLGPAISVQGPDVSM